MMTAPKSEIVPDRELARLTILKPSEDAEVTSAGADVTPGLPTLDSLDGVPVLGPPNNPLLKVQLPAAAETSKPHDDYITNGVDASSVPGWFDANSLPKSSY